MGRPKNTPRKFWGKVNKTDGCWLFPSTGSHGYGQFTIDFKNHRAHRLSYELTHNIKLRPDQVVMHSCDVKNCVNPDHLFLGTHQDNMDDKVNKNRQAKGKWHGMAKLSEIDVLCIRAEHEAGKTAKDISEYVGVSDTHIGRIVNRDLWRHI